jgi:hypothetical protein
VIAGAVSYLAFSVELTMLPLGPSNDVLAVLLGLAAAAIQQCQPPAAETQAEVGTGRAAKPRLVESAS